MNRFYNIKPATNTTETGSDFPQLMIVDDYNFKAINSVHNISFHNLPDFIPDLRFALSENSKKTSILSQAAIASYGFIVHKDLISFWNQYNLPDYKTFTVSIHSQQGYISGYSWLQFLDTDSINLINWNKSDFIVKKLSKNLGPITINDYNQYIQKSKEIGSLKKIKVNHLVLNSLPNYDIFYFPFTSKIYISDNLYSQMKNSMPTGIKYIAEDSISVLQSEI